MKIAVFADDGRRELLHCAIESLCVSGEPAQCIQYRTYDEFIGSVTASGCRVMVVAQPGAKGMEGVRAARVLLPEVPLLWFSDDKGFGPESYRAGCSYFSAEPLTPALVERAFHRIKI